MKNLRIPFLFLVFLAIGSISASAAQLASAKVIEVVGNATKYQLDGKSSKLAKGDILKQGDSISVTALSQAKLVFSNGSELTVEENTSISLKELSQSAYAGNQSYEQLTADPSVSQTILELNYGELNGHVKSLQQGSKFDIQTPLGTAAIRGTTFSIKLRFNAERGEFSLIVKNKDGKVSIISRYAGAIVYSGGVGDKGYDISVSDDKEEAIPPTHTVILRINRGAPGFEKLFNLISNFIPEEARPDPQADDKIIIKIITPEDPGTQVVSPETQAISQPPAQN